MVIHEIDIQSITVIKAEDNPPVTGNADAPDVFEIAFETVQAVAGKIHVRRLRRHVQVGQNVFDALRLIGAKLTRITFIETLEPAMPDRLYQCRLYRVSVRDSSYEVDSRRFLPPRQVFDMTPQLGILAAGTIEKGPPLFR